jgi:hypothetical protein
VARPTAAIANAAIAMSRARFASLVATGAPAALPVVPGERVGPTPRTLGDGVTDAEADGTGTRCVGGGTLVGLPVLCVTAGVGVELEWCV